MKTCRKKHGRFFSAALYNSRIVHMLNRFSCGFSNLLLTFALLDFMSPVFDNIDLLLPNKLFFTSYKL